MNTSLYAVVRLIFGALALITGIILLILNYHWGHYSANTVSAKVVQLTYTIITAILFLITLITFFNISS
ncbi:MAG: hypothetical protein KGI50_02065 [Patescibacteria group bacterium]|nr:hypothetical protein [Patescibacteria group bacterium]MDE2437869.1 hypothetical protein [Patescibacteria group bacterium]